MNDTPQRREEAKGEARGNPTDRPAAQDCTQDLQESLERYRLATEISSEIILDYSVRDDSIYHVTNRICDIYGIPQTIPHAPEQLILCNAVLPESAPAFLELFHNIRMGLPQASCVVKSRTRSDEIRWNYICLRTLFDESGFPCRAIGVLRDITDQRQAELREETQTREKAEETAAATDGAELPAVTADNFTQDSTLYNALCKSTDDYIYMCDMSQDLFFFPPAMVEEFGLPGQVIYGAIALWATYIHENDRAGFLRDIERMVSGETNFHNLEYRARTKDGVWVWLRCRGYLERAADGQPTLFAGILTNLGKKTKIDQITGIPDKYEFELQVRAKLSDTSSRCALLLLGLDNFKHINNLYGWAHGDNVLWESAQRLQSALSAQTQLYRLDGDKFGVFFPEGSRETVEQYFQLASTRFQHQYDSDQYKYFCTISGGYVLSTGNGATFDALSTQAEYALEYAKTSGKNQLAAYDDQLMRGKTRELALIELLQESVEENFSKFHLHFQPQVDAQTHRIHSAEALLRWSCEKYGAIRPDEFIPLLEQTGLIRRVGMWVIRQAAATCRAWRELRPDFTISVNVSFSQLQDRLFLEQLSELVKSGELTPDSIHLEMTESGVFDSNTHLSLTFERLRSMGFHIEMDDFGTGYSSLSILKNAPADVVKIDRSFVQNITRSEFDVTFIRFVVALCHTAGILVCLEGVETQAEYETVAPLGLDFIQGFLFGRPQSAKDFEALLQLDNLCLS